jgi:phage/conjugal plasmid C-4 type zinc finger TraR family protein
MAEEWVKEGAAQEKIDATAKHTKSPAQSQSPQHSGSIHCTECGAEIPQARREAIPCARLCVVCQEAQDHDIQRFYTRPGSKDRQLR